MKALTHTQAWLVMVDIRVCSGIQSTLAEVTDLQVGNRGAKITRETN